MNDREKAKERTQMLKELREQHKDTVTNTQERLKTQKKIYRDINKIIKDQDFVDNFKALAIEPEVVAVKAGTREAANEVDSISGATISSKAVVKIINAGNLKFLPLIAAAHESEEQP